MQERMPLTIFLSEKFSLYCLYLDQEERRRTRIIHGDFFFDSWENRGGQAMTGVLFFSFPTIVHFTISLHLRHDDSI